MRRLIIGAPFGNYLRWPGTIPTLGTFTFRYRAGFWLRLWRVLKTVRYYHRTQSWVNRLGLPNPGIAAIREVPENAILSIHGFNSDEWVGLTYASSGLMPGAIEFNISCPNVSQQAIDEVLPAITMALTSGDVIVKLPPICWMKMVDPLYAVGVRNFHLCNTMPSPGGGISGLPLKQYSLLAVEEVRTKYPDARIIGGGGITDIQDVKDYLNAGADDVSVASMLFNPFNWKKVVAIRDYLTTL